MYLKQTVGFPLSPHIKTYCCSFYELSNKAANTLCFKNFGEKHPTWFFWSFDIMRIICKKTMEECVSNFFLSIFQVVGTVLCVPKSQNNFFYFCGYNSGWKTPNIWTSKLYKVTTRISSRMRAFTPRARASLHGFLWKFY